MNINLSEHEADWLKKLLEVHECEMSDTILGKIARGSQREAFGVDNPSRHRNAYTPAQSNLYGSAMAIPGSGTGGGIQ